MSVQPECEPQHVTAHVAIVGHLAHGKTMLMDMFVRHTHTFKDRKALVQKEMRYTDSRKDERQRKLTVKMSKQNMQFLVTSIKR